MKLTSSQLRRLIIEALDVHEDELDVPEAAQTDDMYSQQYFIKPKMRAGKEVLKARKDIKKLWNKHADHAYFNDYKQIAIIHYLSLYGSFASKKSNLLGYFDTSNPKQIRGIHIPNKNELSCYGYDLSKLGQIEWRHQPFFTFKKYYVTFASFEDVASEFLSNASPEIAQYYKSSGLPKRPHPGIDLSHHPISREDVVNNSNWLLEEVFIDNWIVDTYYGYPHEERIAKKLGLKFRSL